MRTNQTMKTVLCGEASATTMTGTVDTRGFRNVRIQMTSASTGAPTTATKLEQSDDNSTWESIPGLVRGTDYTLSTTTNSSTVAKVVWDVSMIGRKRYLKATVEHATSGRGSITAVLLDPYDAPSNSSESGAASYVAG